MKKSRADLANAMARILDSKTPNGVAEVPLTPSASKRSAMTCDHRHAVRIPASER